MNCREVKIIQHFEDKIMTQKFGLIGSAVCDHRKAFQDWGLSLRKINDEGYTRVAHCAAHISIIPKMFSSFQVQSFSARHTNLGLWDSNYPEAYINSSLYLISKTNLIAL